jgi:pyroglutamyl-peptidase
VICFGVGTSVVQIETTAHNGYHSARPKDNAGRQPPREKIVPGGKDTLLTQLPVAETRRALQLAGIGATTSEDAGGYLCNECFYRLMALDGEQARGIKRRGFVHVPMVGVKDPEGGAFGLEKLERAVRIIIEQTARAAQ